jgi:hypothetical protein
MINLNHKRCTTEILVASAKMLILVILGTLNATSWAAEITVTNTEPFGPGSLAQAVDDANILTGKDTIVFDRSVFGSAQNIKISRTLKVTDDLLIDGSGTFQGTVSFSPAALSMRDLFAVEGQPGNRVEFEIKQLGLKVARITIERTGRLIRGVNANIYLDDLTLSGQGNTLVNGSGAAIAIENGNLKLTHCRIQQFQSEFRGGAIYAMLEDDDKIIIDHCALSENRVVGKDNSRYLLDGGAIYIEGGFTTEPNLIITNSELSDNATQSGSGGAISASQTINISISNSTLSGNSAYHQGGGLYLTSQSGIRGASAHAPLFLQSTTITNNFASEGGGLRILTYRSIYPVSMANSVIAGNHASPSGTNFRTDIYGGEITASYSMIGSIQGVDFVEHSSAIGSVLTEIDPMFAPLTNNKGQTQTHALQAGSPLIDAGKRHAQPKDDRVADYTFDQRGNGYARVQGANMDIGAFEFQVSTNCNNCGGGTTGNGGGGGSLWLLLIFLSSTLFFKTVSSCRDNSNRIFS